MTDGLTIDNKVSSKTVELYSFSDITLNQFNQKTEMCHYDSSIKESRGYPSVNRQLSERSQEQPTT